MKGSTQTPRSTGSRELIRRWLPPLVWMGVIFFVSARSTLPSAPGRWDLLFKKTMHVLAYGFLTWLYLRALRGGEPRGNRPDSGWTRAVSAGMALLYALSDEYHQTFVSGRHGSLVDVAIDGLGISAVLLLDWGARRGGRRPDEEASG